LLAQYINWFLVRDLPQGAADEFIRNPGSVTRLALDVWPHRLPAILFFVGMLIVRKAHAGCQDGVGRRRRILTNRGKDYADAAVGTSSHPRQ